MKNKFIILIIFFISSVADASLIKEGWSGTVVNPDWADGGGISAGHDDGSTWLLTNFNTSAYDDLYFTLEPGMGLGEELPMLYNSSSSNLAGGISVWQRIFDIDIFNHGSGQWETQSVTGSFTLTVKDMYGNALALTEATAIGLDADVGGLLHVMGDFKANLHFEINGQSALPWFDSQSTRPGDGGQLWTGASTAFYYSEPSASASVPEPSTLAIFALGVIGLASRRFKKKS